MNTTWANLYVQLKAAYGRTSSDNLLLIVQNFVKAKDLPKIKPQELELILQYCGNSGRAEVSAALNPYMVESK